MHEIPARPTVFVATRTGSTANALTVPITCSGTASAADFTTVLPATVLIPVGQTSATITLTPVDDALVEGSETLIVAPAANASYTIGTQSSVTLTISDNDTAMVLPTVTITSTDPHGAETWDYLSFTLT